MKTFFILALFSTLDIFTIYKFNKNTNTRDWQIVDDVVMGGQSNGNFKINSDGFGEFYGEVSIENNGGFSSIRHNFEKISVNSYTTIKLRVKGDGKNYQLRIKANDRDFYSYITTFETSGQWEYIQIPLKSLYPSFRGRKLNLPNFQSDFFEEISFLIANNKSENFKLLIDKIELE